MPPALVLAAGQGTRIAPVSGGGPKPLLELGGRSLLAWNLEWLAKSGVERVWINLHHGAEAVRAAVGDGSAWGLNVRYSPEARILGTAGAWRRLEAEWDGLSLVVYGDNLTRFGLDDLLAAHAAAGAAATLALFDPGRHANTGIAGGRVRLQGDRVAAFVEGSEATDGLVSAGVYVLEPRVSAAIPVGFADFGRDVFPTLAAKGVLAGHVVEDGGFCLGVDTPAAFRVAEAMLRSGKVVPA